MGRWTENFMLSRMRGRFYGLGFKKRNGRMASHEGRRLMMKESKIQCCRSVEYNPNCLDF